MVKGRRPQPARALGAGAGLSPGWAVPTPARAPPSHLQTLGSGSSGAASRADPQPSGRPCWKGWVLSPLVLRAPGCVPAPPPPTAPSSSLFDSLCPGPRSHLRKTGCPPKPVPAPQAAAAEPLVGPQDPEAARWPQAPGPLTSAGHVSEFQHPRAWRQLSCYLPSLNCLFFFPLTLWISKDSES